jgi:dCTP deaminase
MSDVKKFGILTHEELWEKRDELFKGKTYAKNCFRSANYDLRLGSEIFISTEEIPRQLDDINDAVNIKSGEFALLTTHEYIIVPTDMIAFISLRFRYAVRGLINISGFHVDPGFEGKLVFSVYNAGPNDVVLRYKDPVFMIIYERLYENTKSYTDVGGEFGSQEKIRVEWIAGLRGIPVSIKDLDNRVRNLDSQIKIYGGLLVSLIVGFVITLLKIILG